MKANYICQRLTWNAYLFKKSVFGLLECHYCHLVNVCKQEITPLALMANNASGPELKHFLYFGCGSFHSLPEHFMEALIGIKYKNQNGQVKE